LLFWISEFKFTHAAHHISTREFCTFSLGDLIHPQCFFKSLTLIPHFFLLFRLLCSPVACHSHMVNYSRHLFGAWHHSKYFTCLHSFAIHNSMGSILLLAATLHMRKQKHREVMQCVQAHTHSKWWITNANTRSFVPGDHSLPKQYAV
jgi:hypothetical protein